MAGLVASPGLHVAAQAAPAVDECASGHAWLRIRSPHFTLLTQGDEAEGRALARELEWLAWSLDQLGWSRMCARPVEATVFAMSDRRCYERFGPRFEGKPVESAGAYLSGPLGSMMILRA